VETQCQKLNCISVQTTGVVLLAPNIMNHIVISNMICIKKKSDFRTFAQLTPSEKAHFPLPSCVLTLDNNWPSLMSYEFTWIFSYKYVVCLL